MIFRPADEAQSTKQSHLQSTANASEGDHSPAFMVLEKAVNANTSSFYGNYIRMVMVFRTARLDL